MGQFPKAKLGGVAGSPASSEGRSLSPEALAVMTPKEATGTPTLPPLTPSFLPAEWRMLKNRPFLGSISQQNIRSQQRPRIQELGNLYTPDSLRPEEGWAFDGFSLSRLSLPIGSSVLGALGTQRGEKQHSHPEGSLRK